MATSKAQSVFRCPVCTRPTPDGKPVWVVGFVVEDDANDTEEDFESLPSATKWAAETGSVVQLDLSDGCRTPNLDLVPYAP